MIRVLIVEDSPVEQRLLTHILSADPQLQVVGMATDGEEALEAVGRLRPDVVSMDIHMPRLNGFDTTRRIMEVSPVPIVIVSGSISFSDVDKTFRAMEAGALAAVRKPRGIGHPRHGDDALELIRTIKMMAEVRVVKRWPRSRQALSTEPVPAPKAGPAPAEIRMVAIGASTGGPTVLQTILSALSPDFPAPILVVQHMATGFMEGFVAWLNATTGFPTHIARHGEPPAPGHAYFAPDGVHLRVGSDRRLILSGDEPENGLRPSVARLFRSVEETFGRHALGVLLTGMGKDGAQELRLMRNSGAVTVAQDQESSVVFGMPGEAVSLGAAKFVLPPERIAELLVQLTRQNRHK